MPKYYVQNDDNSNKTLYNAYILHSLPYKVQLRHISVVYKIVLIKFSQVCNSIF